jgi:hypothetical protein
VWHIIKSIRFLIVGLSHFVFILSAWPISSHSNLYLKCSIHFSGGFYKYITSIYKQKYLLADCFWVIINTTDIFNMIFFCFSPFEVWIWLQSKKVWLRVAFTKFHANVGKRPSKFPNRQNKFMGNVEGKKEAINWCFTDQWLSQGGDSRSSLSKIPLNED